jgi:putative hydrolase of the HAD superfamily
MAIETIIFDFGGVLYKMPDPKQVNRWTKLFGFRGNAEVAEILANPHESQLVKDMCLGKIPEEQVWDMMHSKWRIKPTLLRRFQNQFFSKRFLNKELVRFMEDFKGSFQLGILSNAGDQSRSLMVDVLHLDRTVDEIIISAEEGVIKPDRKIYQIAMDRLETPAENILFLDDYAPNVVAANNFGMHAIQFIDNRQAMSMIEKTISEEV